MITLMYHNLVARSTPCLPVAGGQVVLEDFQRQMEGLRCQLIHPLEVQKCWRAGKPAPKGVLITFDDGATGLLEAGRILSKMGMAAVAFVCPGAVQKGLWFYRLADALTRSRVESLEWADQKLPLGNLAQRRATYHLISDELGRYNEQKRERHLEIVLANLPCESPASHPSLQILDQAGLAQAAETGGVVYGNHTWSHPELCSLSDEEIESEITRCDAWLRSTGWPVLPWLAFPRGAFDARVVATTQRLGLIGFGAERRIKVRDIQPRIGIYRPDGNRVRFWLKTAGSQLVEWARN